MENLNLICVINLPEEIFENIAQYLPAEDLDACFSVCTKWRRILNTNKIWKKCCLYSENYFNINSRFNLKQSSLLSTDSQELCTWRQYYQLQQTVWENWTRGRFTLEENGIPLTMVTNLTDFVDSQGDHWLFDKHYHGITIWNITGKPFPYGKIEESGHFTFQCVADKIIIVRLNYVKVFQFSQLHCEVELCYRFRFESGDIMPQDEVETYDDIITGLIRYIIVDNFFVGYIDEVTDIQTSFLHVWDLNIHKKIATQSAFQQSYLDFILSSTGKDIREDFVGGLLLTAGDRGRCLVTLIDDSCKLCQVSVFSLEEMKFVNVLVRLESITVWCFMKGDVVVVFHSNKDETSQVTVYNVNGQFLAKLDFPGNYNPAFSDEFWFTGSKVFLKAKENLHILTIDSKNVFEKNFKINLYNYILSFFEPKFLLLFDKSNRGTYFYNPSPLYVWDIDTGCKLWELKTIFSLTIYRGLLQTIRYPRRVMFHFKGDNKLSLLNFEKSEHTGSKKGPPSSPSS